MFIFFHNKLYSVGVLKMPKIIFLFFQNYRFIAIFIFICISFECCDYKITEQFIINNNSEYNITLRATFVESRRSDIIDSIPAWNKKVFFSNNTISAEQGLITSKGNNLSLFNTITLHVSDSTIRLYKDVKKNENWEYIFIKNSEIKEYFIFTVDNKDFSKTDKKM